MTSDYTNSRKAAARLQQIVPGGAHAYARGPDQYPEEMPIVIERGAGCHIEDLDGNRYIEYGMGLRSVILGHAYPKVTEAAIEAIHRGSNFVRPSRYELDCAELMLELVPTMEMVKFAKNGSDVTTAAVKLARAATGRELVGICRDHPFFSTDDWFIGTTPMDAGIPESTRSLTRSFPYGDLDGLEEMLRSEPAGFACIILEPEKYASPPEDYLHGVRGLCDRFGACLVFDEMITGFRHHVGGVHLREDVVPDLVTYGKSIANGFASSALMGRRELMQLGGFDHDRERVFLLSTTHGGETHALAATMATLNVIRSEDVLASIGERGRQLTEGIRELTKELGIEEAFEVIGFPTDLVYVTRDAQGMPSQEFRTLFLQETMRRGVLAPSFVLSYSHTADVIDRTLEVLREALAVYAAALSDGIERHLCGRPVRPTFRRYG
jgi:glutamate-1-semialdehyde 2,1-aminomutase